MPLAADAIKACLEMREETAAKIFESDDGYLAMTNENGAETLSVSETRKIPKWEDIQHLKRRRICYRGHWANTCKIEVTLRVVTPILGGSYKTRHIDDIDIIRAPSVRAHLRFWWRALYAHTYESAEALYKAERELWGGAALNEKDALSAGEEAQAIKGGRSPVEVRIINCSPNEDLDDSNPLNSPGGYALWPARVKGAGTNGHLQRRLPQTKFTLQLIGPECCKSVLENVLRAWIIFGGYGSRTRRGLGSLAVETEKTKWLPNTDRKAPNGSRLPFGQALKMALQELFPPEIFSGSPIKTLETPMLAGATLYATGSGIDGDGEKVWTAALDWLQDFRQGQPKKDSDPEDQYARRFGTPNRPGKSNWPEADKIRRVSIQPTPPNKWAHEPEKDYGLTPSWPRAWFGLPIVGQFQDTSRVQSGTRFDRKRNRDVPTFYKWAELPVGNSKYGEEPKDFELRWRSVNGSHDRLASPLIVKALPLADGRFVPCALWLNRKLPENAEVYLHDPDGTKYALPTSMPFEDSSRPNGIIASGDVARFKPLKKPTLRDAFFGWLKDTRRATEVVR